MLDRVFGNRYRLVEKIGIGGMAEVYKSTDEVLGRTVAVKVMLPQYAADPTFAARFKQEAQSAANLQSPYIVNIYDWGQDSTDGTYYIVMEYVRGTDLKTAIQQRGAIYQRKVAEIGSQVCAALSVAHGYDIIHRDIKPHNIMVQPDGNSKVMDFGIARASGSSMTQTGSVLGTAYYISPEQAQGRPLGPSTDLYSLGVVLYEAATGTVPFDAPDAVAVALKQVNEYPVPPSQINPDIDPELEAIIMRALEKNPMDRYATAEQMRVALNNYLAGRPIDTNVEAPAARTRVMGAAESLPVISAGGAQPATPTAVMPPVGGMGQPISMRSANRAKEEADRNKRQRTIIIAVVVSVVAVAAIAILLFVLLNSCSAQAQVEVPDVVGKTQAEATAELETAKFKVKVELKADATVEKDKVISTDPSARTTVNEGSEVTIVVSSGPEAPKMVQVPDLKGKTPTEAKGLLEKVNLVMARGEERFDPEIEVGKICGQDVAALLMVEEGTTITFYTSKGKETVTVPEVKGYSVADAQAMLEPYGLTIEEAGTEENELAAGLIIRQEPGVAATVDKGTVVKVWVSSGPPEPELIDVPNVDGMSKEAAINELKAAGFEVVEATPIYSPAIAKGVVVSHSPSVPSEAGVTIYIVVSLGKEPDTTTPPTTEP